MQQSPAPETTNMQLIASNKRCYKSEEEGAQGSWKEWRRTGTMLITAELSEISLSMDKKG